MTIVFGAGASAVTWTDARDKVRSDLWRGSNGLPDDVVDRALHASLRRLEAERGWLWLENVNATMTVDVASNALLAPSDLAAVNSFTFLNGSRGYDLLLRSPLAQVRENARGAVGGVPSIYSFTGGKLYLDTEVQAGDVFELIYKSRTPTTIDAAIAMPPATLTLQQPAILAAACWHVALNYLKNEEEAARQGAVYETFLTMLHNEEDEAREDEHGGFIQPDTFYHGATFGHGNC